MPTLSLPVDDATADAFRAAPDATRERLTRLVGDYLRLALSDDGLDAYRRAADALGADARAAGWTDDLDAALLRGDLDGDA